MASNKVAIQGGSSSSYIFYIDWSSTADVANNRSTVTARLTCKKNQENSQTYNSSIKGAYVKINGSGSAQTVAWDMRGASVGTERTLITNTVTVNHNADGTKSIPITAYLPTDTTVGGTVSGSTTAALDRIPRATTPTVSAKTVEMGSAVTINLQRASSSFTHTIRYSFGDLSGQTSGLAASSGVGTSTTFTPPVSLAGQIKNTTSGTCTITVTTYSGSTVVGKAEIVKLELIVPSSVKPTISTINISEGAGSPPNIAGQFGRFIQSKSKLKVATTAAGIYGSDIKSYTVTVDGTTYNGQTITSNAMMTSGNRTVSVTVTDNRNRTATSSRTVAVTAYKPPVIEELTAARCRDAAGTYEDSDGTYVRVKVKGEIANIPNNPKKFVLKYKKQSESAWQTQVLAEAFTYNNTVVVSSINAMSTYDFAVEATDFFSDVDNPVTRSITIPTAQYTYHARSGGKGLAVGKASETDGLFDVAWNMKAKGLLLNDPLTIPNGGTGGITSKSARMNLDVYSKAETRTEILATQKPFMTLRGTNSSVNTSSAITTLALATTVASVNTSGYLQRYSNTVQCLKAGYVLISGAIYYSVPAAGSYGAYIYVGNSEAFSVYRYHSNTGAVSAGTSIVRVAASDYIYLRSRSSVSATCSTANAATYLTVMYI